MTRRQAVGYLLVSVLLWSTSGLLVKLLPWNALAISGARSAIAAVVIWAYLRHPHFTWSRPQIGGAVTLVLMQTCFVIAVRTTTAANAIFLQYSAPVFVALFGSWYLGERARPVDWLAMGAVLAGMSLFLMDGLSAGGLVGSAFAICAGISMAWFILFIRKQKYGSPTETVLLGNLMGAAIGLPFVLWALRSDPPLGVEATGIVLFLGIFQLGIPYILYSQASRELTAIEATLIMTLEPILNPLWVFLVIDERPGPLALLGGFIVVATVTLTAIHSSRQVRLIQPVPAAD